MLHYETIDTATLELLKKIQAIPIFENLRLVGGTSLALQIGHRISVDLDFFGEFDCDDIAISNELKKLGNLVTIQQTSNIKIFSLNGIKADFVNYPYPWLNTPLFTDQICLASVEDMAAMKLSAITSRGSKKDFIDIYFLLQEYSLNELIEFYQTKYDDGSVFLVLKSLVYFDDAEDDIMPRMLQKVEWNTVKQFIVNIHKRYCE